MEHWNELRTALALARLGTVSAAAEALLVHRATVNRHIDVLEQHFGAPLFQRHARGYTLTETGQHMMEVASRAEEMFNDLAGQARGQSSILSGSLIVTSLSGIVPLIMPAVAAFHSAHPIIGLEFVTSQQLARLEHGEAHIALRAGPKPQTPDYVVKHFRDIHFRLYASHDYIARKGRPTLTTLHHHHFVGAIDPASKLPYAGWMAENISAAQLVLRTSDQVTQSAAVKAGLGLGFIAEHEVEKDSALIPALAEQEPISAPIWIVTHVDLHRTQKVQEFLKYLR